MNTSEHKETNQSALDAATHTYYSDMDAAHEAAISVIDEADAEWVAASCRAVNREMHYRIVFGKGTFCDYDNLCLFSDKTDGVQAAYRDCTELYDIEEWGMI